MERITHAKAVNWVPRMTPGWTPLAGDALLDRLRVTGRPRPLADPDRVLRLRESIEQGLACKVDDDNTNPEERPTGQKPIVITKDRLTRALAGLGPEGSVELGVLLPTLPMACGALIDVLFRQLVTTGSIVNALDDGLMALALDDRQRPLVTWIGKLSRSERGELAAEVARQSADLVKRWPSLDPAWLPRTHLPMRVGLAGGSVELAGRVDLTIGRSGLDVASVAIIEVKSGARRPEHRYDLHFYALLETLRSPAPPFVVATYYTRTGELDVEPVGDDLLFAAARRTLAGARHLRHLALGAEPSRLPHQLGGKCLAQPICRPAAPRVTADATGVWQ